MFTSQTGHFSIKLDISFSENLANILELKSIINFFCRNIKLCRTLLPLNPLLIRKNVL